MGVDGSRPATEPGQVVAVHRLAGAGKDKALQGLLYALLAVEGGGVVKGGISGKKLGRPVVVVGGVDPV